GAAAGAAEVHRLADLAWRALCYTNDARLSAAVAGRLFPSPLAATAAQLESFAACPFQHFAAYGLGLAGRADGAGGGGVSPLHLSRVYHDALEAVVASGLNQTARFADLPPAELSAIARKKAHEIAEELRGAAVMAEARTRYLIDRVARTLDMVLGTVRAQLARGAWGPMKAGVEFGPGAPKLAGPTIDCGGGKAVRLRGRIDRVDVAPDGGLAVYDYRLGENKLSAAGVYHGLSLRLLACVLVLDRAGGRAGGKPLVPVAAFCARLLRSPQQKPHPDECLDPASADFLLATKPRGAFRESHFRTFDPETAGGYSPVLAAFVTKDGGYGMRNASDVATGDEFDALVAFVEHKVAELAGGVLGGHVGVEPYLYHDVSPCPRCEFRSVCRFEPGPNRYRKLVSLGREDALNAMREAVGARHGAGGGAGVGAKRQVASGGVDGGGGPAVKGGDDVR
ncbi:MAG: ATP-dependent nuclease subunit, partial [Phycisphaerales bacterium]|nr:ATP-dependent nuclease subunit [Phycisphaerales bacterium]